MVMYEIVVGVSSVNFLHTLQKKIITLGVHFIIKANFTECIDNSQLQSEFYTRH